MNFKRRWELFIKDPSAVLVFVFVLAYFLVFIWGEQKDSFAIRGTINEIVGIVLFGMGVALAFIARKQLGDNWSPSIKIKDEKGKKLITSGLYSKVRHPIYLSLILMIAGIDLYSFDYVLLGLSAANLIIIVVRSEFEEKELKNRFGDEYYEYEKKTKKILPGIY